jgi:hypothetical protein
MKAKAAFYFLMLYQQLLSLERYRRKKGVEVKGSDQRENRRVWSNIMLLGMGVW